MLAQKNKVLNCVIIQKLNKPPSHDPYLLQFLPSWPLFQLNTFFHVYWSIEYKLNISYIQLINRNGQPHSAPQKHHIFPITITCTHIDEIMTHCPRTLSGAFMHILLLPNKMNPYKIYISTKINLHPQINFIVVW